jgi:hypothetical protein
VAIIGVRLAVVDVRERLDGHVPVMTHAQHGRLRHVPRRYQGQQREEDRIVSVAPELHTHPVDPVHRQACRSNSGPACRRQNFIIAISPRRLT